jgi:hypothetical protein
MIKRPNLFIFGVEEDTNAQTKVTKKVFCEILSGKFPNFGKDMDI